MREIYTRGGSQTTIVDYHGADTFHLSNNYPGDSGIVVASSRHFFSLNGNNYFPFDSAGRMTSFPGKAFLTLPHHTDSLYVVFHWTWYDAWGDPYTYDFDFAGKR